VVHALLLGSGQEYESVPFASYTPKRAQEMRDEIREAGRIPILQGQLGACQEVAEKLRGVIPAGAQCEVTAVWESVAGMTCGPVLCRRRIDALLVDEALVLDLKTTEDAARTADPRQLAGLGRDMEAAATLDCLETLLPKLAGRWRFAYIVAELAEPFARVEVDIAGSMLELGRRKWRRAVELWGQCIETGSWPGPFNGHTRPAAPEWAINQEMDAQLAAHPGGGGEALMEA
jgi:hypothetical protein